MSGEEAIICPFCGAPFRKQIPFGTVQVNCRYCGGTILVPKSFGGELRRCPNHPDVLAVGLCNDCGGSFCDSCLSYYSVEDGSLNLCPNCLKTRESDKATFALILGFLMLFAGAVAVLTSGPAGVAIGGFFIVVFALPFIAWGIFKTINEPEAVTVKERNEIRRREQESQENHADSSGLYSRLVDDYLRDYGPKIAYDLMERRISLYISAGKTRDEAIRRLAEERGYI